ncbi:uncharacterized protein LOC124123842 isoform X2 [Haliotis rufescens]|uniref:uncharacterized protein LOC124123842 isoform X2 n=1 Tax=Haliotis rufescens TaxID=6454 RepID=UPI00201F3CA4|nr:uncharacterized protein LOC124123842 isoform X2 [Haliotis rufescens]
MEGNPDSRDRQMTRWLAEEAAEALRGTEQGRQPTSISATQHNYSGPVSQVDLTNASNVSVSLGEQGARGCLSQERFCQKVGHVKEYFVDIHALQTAKQLLETHGHVTVCGAPGDGKTSIAMMICEAYQQKKYETVFVEHIEHFDVDTISKRQSHLLVVFDDIFGSVTFSANLEKLRKLFSALVDDLAKTAADTERDSKKKKEKQSKAKEQSNEEAPIYSLKVVFTSRTYNWQEGCSKLHQYKVDLLKTEAVLNMTKDCLTVEEKKRILRSYKTKHPTCDISEKDICCITNSRYNIFGFPLIGRLFFTNAAFQMHILKFFNHPLTYLRGDLDTIVREENNRSAAIILLILCDGNLNLVSLQSRKSGHEMFDAVKEVVPCCTRTGIAKEIHNFTGIYCTVEDHIASFSHPSIYDAAACAVGHLNIVLLLEHCSLKFMYERVRLGKDLQSSDIDDVTNMTYITPGLHQTIVNRLVEGIRQGCFIWTVKHPVLHDESIASLVWTEIEDNIVEIVLQKDKDSGDCFLYLASISESYFLFSKCLDVVGRLGDTVPDLYGCVVACVTLGKLKHLEHLVTVMCLHEGFDVEYSIDGQTLLLMAAKSGHLEVFNFLRRKDADASARDWKGKTCLHYACESGSMALTTKATETCPVLINLMSYEGLTPAMLCAKAGHLDILKFLKQKGADLTLTDKTDCLHLASENGNLSTVIFLISLKTFDVNKKKTRLRQTAAMMAAKGGHCGVYQHLVSEGADLTLTDQNNTDCLMLACEGGHISIVKHILLMKICDINRQGGFWKHTPIMMALRRGHCDVCRLLVSEGADLTLTDEYNTDCLMFACEGGNMSIVKHILSMRTCDINRRGGYRKRTPIMMAAHRGHYGVYHLLVSEGADLTLTDKCNKDCLMFACEGGNMSIVKHILSMRTCDINRRGGYRKRTPIMMTAERGHYGVYHLLVSESADLTLTDQYNKDCLMSACEGGNISIVKHILSMKTCDINRRGGYRKQTPIMMALKGGHNDVYHLLVSEGADLTLTDQYNTDCLMFACEGGNISIVKHILSLKTCDINRRRGELKKTPIMMTFERGDCDVYHLLVSEGADLARTDADNTDCLMSACEGGNISIVKHILSMKTCDINRRGGYRKQTPIMMALEEGHYDVCHLLVSEGADLTLTDEHNRDCLMLACERGNISIVKHILSLKTCDINRRRGEVNKTPIMMTLERGHCDVYHLLASEGADLTLTDKNNTDCLMLACEGGNIFIVRHILSMKTCDINRRGGDMKQTPIMMALEGGHYDVYHLLVSEGADLTISDEDNQDCLMLACEKGITYVVKHILSMKTCDINRRRSYGKQTPVMMALKRGHYDVYHLLVSEGADLTLTDKCNTDCLMLACERGNIYIVKHILSMKTCDINRRGGYRKQTPIMMALKGGHNDVYHLLVSEGADLNLTDEDNTDCLMLACQGGNISIVKHILSLKTCDVNRRGGELKQTPIMMALEGGGYDVYHLLVSEGADLALTDEYNKDCLMLACERGNISIVKHILSMKTCDINRRGAYSKQTPIMMALNGGNHAVYHLLVSEGADLTLTDKYNIDCLMLACEGGNISIVKHILTMKTCDINRRGAYGKQTPIMMALEGGHHAVYHLLVSEGADLALTDENNTDCLMLACEGGNISIVKHILSMKTCDINRRGGYRKQTPVMMALKGGHFGVYHLLVSEGADLTLTDEYNTDSLMLACEGGNISIVKHILSMKTCDINRRGGEQKQTPMMMALKGGHNDVYYLLVSEGADPTLTDKNNTDSLMLACEGGNVSIVRHILSLKTCDINRRGGERKKTPMMMALEEGHNDVYHLLVSEGADLTLTDKKTTDCLMLACERGNISIVRHILSLKTCDINIRGRARKQTPMMMALEEGHNDVCHLLVSEGADLTPTDEFNTDCLMLACEKGNISIVRHTLSLKICDINRRGGELKQTPIMIALKGGHNDVYHLLVSEGGDLTLKDKYNTDCLMLACERGNISIVRHILSLKTCDINRRGGYSERTPIMMALNGKYYDIYHLLVSEGADLSLVDKNNTDCLMLACERGDTSIVRHILSLKTCDINRRGGERKQTPMMMALKGGHNDVYHLLVSEGADLTLTDEYNTDCLMLACEGGNISIVKHILSLKTCDTNRRGGEEKQTPMMIALKGGHNDVYHLLVSEGADPTLTDKNNSECLMLACERGNISIVRHILSMKTCDSNRRGGERKQTPMMLALKGGHNDVYHLLVSEGADRTLTDEYNTDSLMLACERGNISIVKHILSMKTCDINRRGGERKQTPMMMALEEGHNDVYHLLVSEGGDLTLTDKYNTDCLMLACERGNISIVRHILSLKTCDINRRGGEKKQIPMMMALKGGHNDVYHLLVSEGADLTPTDECNRD